MPTDRTALIDQAKQVAEIYQLDPALVCAVCEQESNWDPAAVRFEPAFLRRYIHPEHPDEPTTEELTCAMSFGLMQVMGKVAREQGFQQKFLTALCDPGTGLSVGCKLLAKFLAEKDGDVEAALLRWNGGGNPDYGKQVMARMGKYQ